MIICRGLDKIDQINSLEEWKEKCPPEKPKIQWVEGRSAHSLASYWLGGKGEVPNELDTLLNSHPDLGGTRLIYGSPEYESRFDSYGKGRQHDFLSIGSCNNEKILLSVEAKVDESFGNETIESYYIKAKIKQLNGENTKVTNRIEELLLGVFKKPLSNSISTLRYQLIHAIAGTLAESKKQEATKAIFIIQAFTTDKACVEKVIENNKELDKLIKALSGGRNSEIANGELLGPFNVPGNSYIPSEIPLYIGKIVTKI
ncbi:DUF6946 family protein [Robertmurraya sp. P23]|uniref:DUF6946 family protein n=1 Tax=Robertmurraya sp. P23 TaxID=3436931 RepID=UPI003D981B4C